MATRNPDSPKNKAVASQMPSMDTEVANRLRDPFETNYMGVLRTNDPLLLERSHSHAQMFDLYRDLKRDGKVFSGLQKRKLALISRPWQVDPVAAGEAGKRDAQIVQSMLKRVMFDKLSSELLDALLMGFVPAEIVWTLRDGLVTPARVVKRAQRRFVYVQTDPNASPELHLLTAANMLTGEPVPPKKFIAHRFNPEDDNPYGMGLGLQLYWPVFFKRKGIIAWNKLNDRFGSPTPWGKYPNNSGAKEKGTLFDALKAMSNDGVIMTPEGMNIELLESKLTGSINSQESLCNYMDNWISEVILSQESTHQTGATGAASKEREDVRLDLVQADADLLSDTLNSTLVQWFCEFNGLSPCQVSRVVKQPEDLKAASETDLNVSKMGFRRTLESVCEKYGDGWEEGPEPQPDPVQDPATPATTQAKPQDQTATKPPETASFAESTQALPAVDPTRRETDRLVLATAPAWRAMVDQIQGMVNTATNFAEVQQTIVQAYGDLDSSELVKLMAAAMALAELKGMDSARMELTSPATASFAEPAAAAVATQAPAQNINIYLPEGMVKVAAAPAPNVQFDVHVPLQAAPVVNNTVMVPEQAPAQINVQPADVVVNNMHPERAVQTVERDPDSLEITRTVIHYEMKKE